MIAIGEARYNWKTARTMEQAVSETDHVKRMSEQPASMVRHCSVRVVLLLVGIRVRCLESLSGFDLIRLD